MKERWFNYRPLCLVFCFLVLGSVFACYIKSHTLVTIIVAVLVFAFVIILAVIKKKLKYFLIPIISFVLAVSSFYIAQAMFNRGEVQPTKIQARIYNIISVNDGSVVVHADNVKFDNKNSNTNLIFYIYDSTGLFEQVEIGREIEFSPTKVYKTNLKTYKLPNSNYFSKNLRYTATANISNISFGKIDRTFAETIRQKVKDNLNGVLTNENVEIAYSALFGDKYLMYGGIRESFNLSGVAHLIAVSGLHVGIIAGLLEWILKLVTKNQKIKFGVISVFLLLYCYICSFAVSVIRATIMMICLLFARLIHREYDSLSAISLAGIILFIFNPFVVFDVSFLMSFASVLGITMLYKPIRKVLIKCKFPAWLADSLAISLSLMVIMLFIMAVFFKNLNVVMLIANVIIIPLFTVGFSIVFVVSVLSLLFPFLKYISFITNPIFNFINILTEFFAGFKFANLTTTNVHFVSILIYFFVLLILSRLCTSKRYERAILILPLFALLLLFML